jgi:RNA recognition motif-containing protein
MPKKIYVGNMSYSTTTEELRDLFTQYGEVKDVNIIFDRDTNRSKGFGFVEMENEDAATAAISALNNTDFNGRALKVNVAQDRKPRQNNNYRY